jgi:hypothetical protein
MATVELGVVLKSQARVVDGWEPVSIFMCRLQALNAIALPLWYVIEALAAATSVHAIDDSLFFEVQSRGRYGHLGCSVRIACYTSCLLHASLECWVAPVHGARFCYRNPTLEL